MKKKENGSSVTWVYKEDPAAAEKYFKINNHQKLVCWKKEN